MTASKQQSGVIPKRKKWHSGLIFVVCAGIIIIILGGIGAVYLITHTVSSVVEEAGVQMSCSVSGNDFLVEIQDENAAMPLTCIELIMEGYSMPPALCIKPVPKGAQYPKYIAYESMATGLTGRIGILIKGTFSDSTKKTVWMGEVRFT
ncbi:MAG: hypothetical protein Q4Q04_00145 [Methanocorpusculum sp.]|nr:hypothetical protein [Methanocorpusculum sp.]